MKCLIWRQHRWQLLWTAAVLAAVGVVMVAVAHSANRWLADYHSWQHDLRAAGCPVPGGGVPVHPDPACHALLSKYPNGAQPAFSNSFNFAIIAFQEGVPLLLVVLGVLVGAPLVAREAEQRTHLVAWTQSVSRRGWYATKATVLAGALALIGIVAGVANDHLQIPLTAGGLTSSRWPWFFSMDATLAAEAVLGFALAVALGAWLRRTVAAIGAALVCWLLVFLITAWAIRNITPMRHAAGDRDIPDGSWLLGGNAYHPARQFWPLQTGYAIGLLMIATLLLWAGWRSTRSRGV